MEDHKVNLKKLIVIGLLFSIFGIFLLVLGTILERVLNLIAINVIFSLAIFLILLSIIIFFIGLFKLHKKEQIEKELSEREYISKKKNNVSTLLEYLNYENEILHIPNAKSIYTYLEGYGKYNIEVYIADKRFFISFYESYIEYYCVGVKEFFPEEDIIIKKKISQKMSFKEIEEYINQIITQVVDKD